MLTESWCNLAFWAAGVCSWQKLQGRNEEVLWYKPLVWSRTMSLRTEATAVYICNGLAGGLHWDLWAGWREKHPWKLEKGRPHPLILTNWVHTEAAWAGMAWNDMTVIAVSLSVRLNLCVCIFQPTESTVQAVRSGKAAYCKSATARPAF